MTNVLRAIAVAGLVVCGGCTIPAPPQDAAAAKAKLEADATSWFGFYANADGEATANLYAEDALLMPPGAPAKP